MKRKLILCSLTAMVVLIGCSSGPSERRAKADLQKWFDTRWPRAVLVMKYESLNKDVGDRKCVIEYKARARFLRDFDGCVWTCCGEVCFDKMVNGFRWITKASEDPRIIRTGDLFETSGKNTYTKTGTAWSSDD